MFKYFIKEGTKRNWKFRILIKTKDVLEELLRSENLNFDIIGSDQPTILRKLIGMNKWVFHTLRYSNEFDPDLFIGGSFPHFALAAALKGRNYVILEDSEPVDWFYKTAIPFSDIFITPNCFHKELGKKHKKLNTYLELGYLHPDRFKPDPAIVRQFGIDPDEKFAILRFVAWKAYHDIGMTGLNQNMKRKIIEILEKKNINVYISSEAPLEKEFRNYQIKIPPKYIHHILAYATIFFGDSQTMATEAAILGTPTIRTNTFVGDNDMGNFIELEKDYKLLFSKSDPKDAITILEKLLQKPDLKNLWAKRAKKMLEDKIDLTTFNLDLVENFPESIKQARNS
jgi:predicted glycosyltransferase